MIPIGEITRENWKDILKRIKYNDIETVLYLKEHEEEILNAILGSNSDTSLEEKRKLYVKDILSSDVTEQDFEKVYAKVEEIRQSQDTSILQFGNILPGSSNIVFEFGNRIMKFGKPFRILNNRHILQPEFQMSLEDGYNWMTIFERAPIVYTLNDKDIAQEMYNRIRDDGMVWFDVLGYNVGRVENVRDENDDGLRIIDAQYMEYERDILMRIQPERDPRYRDRGIGAYSVAMREYIVEKGYGKNEIEYQRMKEERRKNANKKDIEVVAKQSSVTILERVKNVFSNLFHSKGTDKDER